MDYFLIDILIIYYWAFIVFSLLAKKIITARIVAVLSNSKYGRLKERISVISMRDKFVKCYKKSIKSDNVVIAVRRM